MELLSVLAAGAAGWLLGAVWYMALSKPWMEAAGFPLDEDGKPQGNGSPMPIVISGVAILIVAGMMRHMFGMAGIDTAGKTLIAGLGIGLFIIVPWITMNYAYSMRPFKLTLIDGGYAVAACGVVGLVLGLF
ncbi:DUF1761 domain-containing protein [Pseudoprimorskyibacter insulae]|uniref:DUF1761 domain-containing protein n=1 Tax=Pseudoprimorskyibacter insulae TaxID=1695997 RepID=A0A2R8AYR3_9RHOB|nr:DUF1761 domain-containing protein [Pseudoprimorskyibacter insulae]SPF81148.1 hypothetical protein PRI8871_02969 [Pseudoprimorskyibacter insulae]